MKAVQGNTEGKTNCHEFWRSSESHHLLRNFAEGFKSLGSHLSANGTECYITSDMFYVEVHLDTAGQLRDVKVAHHGENPVSCPELVQNLRERNFNEFSKHLKGLVNLYKVPGDNKLKTKMYLALQSLELDLSKMAGMYWQATNASPLDKILHGSHLMNLKYYVSPYDLFEEGTGAPIILNENNVPRYLGMNVCVTIEGTLTMNKLPIAPLIMGTHPVDNKGTPSFSSVTSANSVDFPACFFLKFPKPVPVSQAFIQKLQNCTGIPLFDTPPTYVPLYELITQFELSKEEGEDPCPLHHTMRFYAALPGQQHCYFLNKDAPLPDGRSLQGTLLNKIAFHHPSRVPLILSMIRHQVAYNTLIGSCVKRTVLKEDSPGILQFEVCPLSDSCFMVMEVQDSTHVNCKLYKGLSDALICTDDFIAKVVQRPSGGSDKLASPMKPVPGTPPSSKAKSPISSGSGGSHIPGTGSSSSMKSSSGMGSSSSMSQKPPPSNSSMGSSSSFSSGSSSMSSSQNQHGSSKGKSPSRNKKPSLTAVIDKLKHGVVTSGPTGEDSVDGHMVQNSSSSGHSMSSKHNLSGNELQGKRERSDKEKSKVPASGGSTESSKKASDSKSAGSTGVAKIIISKHDGGSPSIKAKVTLQKPGEGSGDGLRPQMSSSKNYGSPLISGSTPKHERCSPSHSKSPAYTPQNIDSESESGSSIAEKSYQNSPSSDDGVRPLPEYSSEKHKKHKKEKKKLKDKDRDRDRDKERDKKKSHNIKPESWSKSPISSEQSLSMTSSAILTSDRPSRPSPDFLIGEEDDDLMDVALIRN
ncbi:hypothetical protein E2320_002725 [Naja naja]|nr:hypothetical protein E2320_002725 [Naja naja]